MKIGYLGPEGTFTHQAAMLYIKNFENAEMIPFKHIPDILQAVEKNEIDKGVVPFENSIEGTVTFTIDTLIFDVNVFIESEIILPIRHNIAVKESTLPQVVEKIFSHPQALAQCRKYLNDEFKDVENVQAASTAKAAEIVSNSKENWAAICTCEAAEKFGLKVIGHEIQDESHNKTRFFVVSGHQSRLCTNCGKTSIVFATEDRPGELYKILDIIAIWNINMTKIESRPMKDELGKYVFYIDMESADSEDINSALKMIERKTSFFKRLGTYHTIGR